MDYSRYDSTSDLKAAAAAYRAAGYPEALVTWLTTPNSEGRERYRGWPEGEVIRRLGIGGDVGEELFRKANAEAGAGWDPGGDPAYHEGFVAGNWAWGTGGEPLIDTANPRFIAWVLSKVPASDLPDPDA